MEKNLEPLSFKVGSAVEGKANYKQEKITATEGFDYSVKKTDKPDEQLQPKDLITTRIRDLVEQVYLVSGKKVDNFTLQDLFLVKRLISNVRGEITVVLINVDGSVIKVDTIGDDLRDYVRVDASDVITRAKVKIVNERMRFIDRMRLRELKVEGETDDEAISRLLKNGTITESAGAFK